MLATVLGGIYGPGKPQVEMLEQDSRLGWTPYYRKFIQTHLKLIVFLPQSIDSLSGDAKSFLISLAKQVHLLLILPPRSADITGPRAYELDIIAPDRPRIFVHTNILQR